MLSVVIDVFSGRPNPAYTLSDEEARGLLRDVARRRSAITDPDQGFDGLGFRGVVVESLSDDTDAFGPELPSRFRVGGGAALDEANGLDLAERLVRGLADHEPAAESTPVDGDLTRALLAAMDAPRGRGTRAEPDGAEPTAGAERADVCRIERSRFNPGFWNAADTIGRNNCYNYASNWRTNTFAQPGRGVGQQYSALSCPSVTNAAFADGCHRRFDCFPDSESPRYVIALVMAPGVDYHWYRLHTRDEGFWGHKPGGTAARKVDNSNRLITSPETADRS